MRLVLASASPRRRELLTAAGLTFDVCVVEVDERPRLDERPSDYVLRLAGEKAAAALKTFPGAEADLVVLAADTTVVVDGEILGKPENNAAAGEILSRLSGRDHEVLTGISLRDRHRELAAVETTRVWFSPLSAGEIAWYVGTGEGLDKAGAYAIQGLAARFIPRIDGSYTNVVGLPVHAVFALLEQLRDGHAAVASQGKAGLS